MLCGWEGNLRPGKSNGSLLPGGWLWVHRDQLWVQRSVTTFIFLLALFTGLSSGCIRTLKIFGKNWHGIFFYRPTAQWTMSKQCWIQYRNGAENHQERTHSGIFANAEDSGTELKTVQAERSFTIPSIMQLSIQRLFCVELYITMTNNLSPLTAANGFVQ